MGRQPRRCPSPSSVDRAARARHEPEHRPERGRLADAVPAEQRGHAALRRRRRRRPAGCATRRGRRAGRSTAQERAAHSASPGRPPGRSRSAITASGVSTGEQRAVVHDRDPVGEAQDDVHVVLDHEHRLALLAVQRADQLDQAGRPRPRPRPSARRAASRAGRRRAASRAPACACRRATSAPAGAAARPASPTRSSAQRARSSAGRTPAARRQSRSVPPRRACAASRTFSRTREQREHARGLERAAEPAPGPAVRRHRAVTSRPPSSTGPPSAATSPEIRLNSVVLPAPFGPMMPRNSPARDLERDIGDDARAADVAARGRGSRGSERRVARSPARDASRLRLAPAARRTSPASAVRPARRQLSPLVCVELGLEHRLQHARGPAARIVCWPFGPSKLQPSSAVIILSTSSPPACERVHDHLRRRRSRPGEQVGHLAAPAASPSTSLSLTSLFGAPSRVVRQERDLRRRPAPNVGYVARWSRPGDDRGRRSKHALLVERLPHRRRGGAGPGDEEQVGLRGFSLLGERREVGGGGRHEHAGRPSAAGVADDGLDGGDVALAEGAVLGEDDDLLARAVAEERARGRDVLVATAGRSGTCTC